MAKKKPGLRPGWPLYMPLDVMMAKACHFAQEHIDDPDAWSIEDREQHLQCVSFQMACFFAQYTALGDGGVDWDVVIKKLVKRPIKSEKRWLKIINKIAKSLGGWKHAYEASQDDE